MVCVLRQFQTWSFSPVLKSVNQYKSMSSHFNNSCMFIDCWKFPVVPLNLKSVLCVDLCCKKPCPGIFVETIFHCHFTEDEWKKREIKCRLVRANLLQSQRRTHIIWFPFQYLSHELILLLYWHKRNNHKWNHDKTVKFSCFEGRMEVSAMASPRYPLLLVLFGKRVSINQLIISKV